MPPPRKLIVQLSKHSRHECTYNLIEMNHTGMSIECYNKSTCCDVHTFKLVLAITIAQILFYSNTPLLQIGQKVILLHFTNRS